MTMWIETPIYRLWTNIKQRCYNPNTPNYDDYGGRGITMYAPWVDNFPLFESYILSLGEKPEGTSIDRVHNDEGYFPMNLRWATRSEQQRNKRPREPAPHNYEVGSSGFKWVSYHKRDRVYRGRYRYRGELIHVGSFDTPEAAYEAVLLHRQNVTGLLSSP